MNYQFYETDDESICKAWINVKEKEYGVISKVYKNFLDAKYEAEDNLCELVSDLYVKEFDDIFVCIDLHNIDLNSLLILLHMKNFHCKVFGTTLMCSDTIKFLKDKNFDNYIVETDNIKASGVLMAMFIASYISISDFDSSKKRLICISRNVEMNNLIFDCIKVIPNEIFTSTASYSTVASFLKSF